MDPISLGLGAIGFASSLFGAGQSAKSNNQAQKLINKQESQAETFYNNRVNRDFLETNAVKGIVEQLRKNYETQVKTIDSNTEATGGTAEANIAAKTAANEQVNDVLNNVAQGATSYQENAENQYQNKLDSLAQQRMALTMQKGQNASNLMGVGANLLGTAADMGAFETGKGKVKTLYGSLGGITQPNRAELNLLAKNGTDKILKGSAADFSDI